jgi:hypothetical protein
MRLALIAVAAMTVISGHREWAVQWIPDGLLLQYETGRDFPKPHEATVAAQKFLRMKHLDCTAGEANSTRAPGYAVSVNCSKAAPE